MKVSKPNGQNCPHEKTWNEMNLRISKKMTDIQLETLFYLTVFAIQLALRKLSKKFSQSDTGKCEYAVQIENSTLMLESNFVAFWRENISSKHIC